MKSLLKAVLLDGEKPGLPGSGTATGALAAKNAKTAGLDGENEEAPGDIADLVRRHLRATKRPPTSIVTIIFLLATHSSEITTLHFEHPHDFYTLFFPHPEYAVPSKQRAQALLWLVWHYLEGSVLLPPGSKPNPFDDDFSRESARKAREAWDALPAAEQQKIKAQGYWKGIKNPKYAEFKKKRSNTRGADENNGEEVPSEYLDRIMAPKLDLISNEESAKENADTEEEKQWGVRMKEERGAFLIRFQEEEQAKIQDGGGGGGGGEGSAREGDGNGKEKGGKKRVMAGGGSSYPLANILAAANAEKAAAAAAAAAAVAADGTTHVDGEGSHGKRTRTDGSQLNGDHAGDDRDPADTLWTLDLTLPQSLKPPQSKLNADGLPTPLLSRSAHSLSRLAWRRILERAQRGVGDASYESDDETVAQDEARDERPRAELARILTCLRQVRTARGEISKSTGKSRPTAAATVVADVQTHTKEPSPASMAAVDAELAEL